MFTRPARLDINHTYGVSCNSAVHATTIRTNFSSVCPFWVRSFWLSTLDMWLTAFCSCHNEYAWSIEVTKLNRCVCTAHLVTSWNVIPICVSVCKDRWISKLQTLIYIFSVTIKITKRPYSVPMVPWPWWWCVGSRTWSGSWIGSWPWSRSWSWIPPRMSWKKTRNRTGFN